ncbi:MAG: DJ-1/PfpI family protein [Planctomycetaceae bacterium]|nr:DJ-1/PfpI family protein [Planctomycetaceae bacterium]
MRFSILSALLLVPMAVNSVHAADEAKWQSLLPAIDPASQRVAGEWKKGADALTVNAATGARLALPVLPAGEYDFRVAFTRKTGIHSIAMVFVHGGKQATLEVDAWGSHLSGIQNIGGKNLRENPTRRENMTLKNGQRYTLLLEVRKDLVRALLDDKVIATHRTDGSDLSLLQEWSLPSRDSLGIGAWESETTFHAIDVRAVGDSKLTIAAAASSPATPSTRPPMKTPATTTASKPATGTPAAASSAAGKRVLIVIANHHFFYREYGDPRQELERAGVKVTVAAGRVAPCRPHEGSGQGANGGVVTPDIAIANVKADDYDAILFSGGWGASMYQFAFNGRYNDASYNGDRATKTQVNRVINDFVAQDKYVAALCNGTSVLAWARVNGKSPLAGKRVCAPQREAPPGIYEGRPAQPSCRWHAEKNGAVMSPPGSIGRPGAADDVSVDGKILTGEDDISAREMGRKLVEVLSSR